MKVAVSLFDESGNMLRPWAEQGYECHCFDIESHKENEYFPHGGSITYYEADLTHLDVQDYIVNLSPSFLSSFGPCTDLATSGAGYFAKKRAINPNFQQEALDLWMLGPKIAEQIGCPWMAENPRSVISTMWRKPDYKFDPCDYGGYLPADDVHPRWPEYLDPRDAYTKETWIWSGNGFIMPPKDPVEPIIYVSAGSKSSKSYGRLGGKSARTKQIRSETPRGFALAVFMANGEI